MQDPQTDYVVDSALKVFLETRLKELEALIEESLTKIDVERLLQLETEHQILATFWRVLDCTARDSSFLDRKGIQPFLRPSILGLLPEKQRSRLIEFSRMASQL